MLRVLRWIIRLPVAALFRVRITGIEHYHAAGERVLIVANHVSLLDGLLLYLFLPQPPTFAINTKRADRWYVRLFLAVAHGYDLDPRNPLALKPMIRFLRTDQKAVVFPEGRISSTGSLMKIYQGPGMIADRADAMVLPIGIEGPQYSRLSCLKGSVKRRWFPAVKITILAPRKMSLPEHLNKHQRRLKAASAMQDIMREVAFENAYEPTTIYRALLSAMRRHGAGRLVARDSTGAQLTFRQLVTRVHVLGALIGARTIAAERVGILLPNTAAAVVCFFAVLARGRVAAMLNFTAGPRGLLTACETADVKVVYTSRAFIEAANLEDEVAAISEVAEVIFLEDLRGKISGLRKLTSLLLAFVPEFAQSLHNPGRDPDAVAVVLFTSGSEGIPKGVALSHANLLANRAQLQMLLDLTHNDVVLNVLPLFHAFGLISGIFLPIMDGATTYYYPTPLHYRTIPELSYETHTTVLFGTNTFLANYAKYAHPYDFHRMRYVIAGAEKLTEETSKIWAERFGVRVLQGYGATEASPVVSVNTPMENRPASVGQLLTKMDYYLEPVAGIEDGGRLVIRGPNIMRGYLFHGGEHKLYPPSTDRGQGWYDTGDIVSVDDDGFITILGREKRFAKIGGEMVSLAQTEELASVAAPDQVHAAVAVPDPRRGEQILLLSESDSLARGDLVSVARELKVSELAVPKRIQHCEAIPLLGGGKVDYPALRDLIK